MLKTQMLELSGKDEGGYIIIKEQPAIVADRHARALLESCGLDPDGGIVSLAFQHLEAVRKHLGEHAPKSFQCFVKSETCYIPGVAGHWTEPRDWRNIERIQNAALALHAGFVTQRTAIEIPVKMQADIIQHGNPDQRVTWCSPFIAAVLNSKYATYVELETVLSTEDCFNLSEIVTINALRDFQAAQRADRN